MNLTRMRSKSKNSIEKINVTLNIPRFLEIKESREIIIKDNLFDFTETFLYSKGYWRIILRQHGEAVYLEKKKVG